MKIIRIEVMRGMVAIGKVRPVIAEIGLSLFVSLGVFTLVSAGLEMLMPGWLTDHLPPQALAVALAVCGAAALLDERIRPSRRAALAYAVAAGAVILLSGLLAWSYFRAEPEARLGLTAAAVLAATSVFWVAFYRDLGQR